MIKIYVHLQEDRSQYALMVIDDDMILHSDVVSAEDLTTAINDTVDEFSDTGREVVVFR